jgi:hypothetical protein
MLDPYVKPLSSGSVLPWLTADRIVTTNSLSQLATPSSISSPQSLTLSGTATATVAGLLTAQSSLTVASTATLQGVTTVVDGNFSILGSSDSTKTIKFEVDAQTAADDLTINSGAQTDDRTATFPVLTGNSILALSNATLTSGRVPFATTNGILTDSANLTFSTANGLISAGSTTEQTLRCGTFGIQNFASGNSWFGENTYYNGANFIYRANGDAGMVRWNSLSWQFQAAPVGVAGATATFVTLGWDSSSILTVGAAAAGRINLPCTSGTTLALSSTQASTTSATGSITTAGGIGAAGALNAGGDVIAYKDATTRTLLIQKNSTTTTTIGDKDCRLIFQIDSGTVNAGGDVVWMATSDTGVERWAAITGGITGNTASGATGFLALCTKTNTTDAALTARLSVSEAGIISISSTDAASLTLAGGALFDGATTKTVKYTNGTANAAVAVTFGAVGPTGSTAGNQVGWLRVNVGGTDRYIPYW